MLFYWEVYSSRENGPVQRRTGYLPAFDSQYQLISKCVVEYVVINTKFPGGYSYQVHYTVLWL